MNTIERSTPLHDVTNVVCGTLPFGWEIVIELELDCGDVKLFDDWGDEIEFPSNRECLADQIADALACAIATSDSRSDDYDPEHPVPSL